MCWYCLLRAGFYIVVSTPVTPRNTRTNKLCQLLESMDKNVQVTYVCGFVMFG